MSIRNIKKASTLGSAPLLRAYDKFLIDRARSEAGHGSHWDRNLHPSMLSGCPTAAALQILHLSVDHLLLDSRVLKIFALGHAIHELLQKDFAEAGLLKPTGDPDNPWAIEVPIEMQIRGKKVVGHADGIIAEHVYGEEAVLEAKSINSMTLSKMPEPKPEHKIQASVYSKALELGLIIYTYYGKNDSIVKEMPYRPTPGDWRVVESKADQIINMVDAYEERGEVPEPAYTAMSQPPCKTCHLKRICHSTMDREVFVRTCKEKFDAAQPVKSQKAKAKITLGKRNPPRRKPPTRRG